MGAPQDGRCGTYCSELLHHTSVVFTDEGLKLWRFVMPVVFLAGFKGSASTSGGNFLTSPLPKKMAQILVKMEFP